MKEIPIYSRGKIAAHAIVDDDIYEQLSIFRWNLDTKGYVVTYSNVKTGTAKNNNDRKKLRIHRLVNNTPDGFETDHINGNKLDNRRCNLRTVTCSHNQANKGKTSRNTSGYKGVSWKKSLKKWYVILQYKNVNYNLGLYDTKELAYYAYCKKSIELRGEFVYKEIKEWYDNFEKTNFHQVKNFKYSTEQTLGITNTSGYRGVSYNKRNKKYVANIKKNKYKIYLGYFDKKEIAAMVYNCVAKILFGDRAKLNIV